MSALLLEARIQRDTNLRRYKASLVKRRKLEAEADDLRGQRDEARREAEEFRDGVTQDLTDLRPDCPPAIKHLFSWDPK